MVYRAVLDRAIHGSPERAIDALRTLEQALPLDHLLPSPLSDKTFHFFTDRVLPVIADRVLPAIVD
jgi:alkanesulfonate monooxygenase SsuD/methylene tetrahydromethanopterin reductase-like flavin-dependent oxidoreductase (luciferase family)